VSVAAASSYSNQLTAFQSQSLYSHDSNTCRQLPTRLGQSFITEGANTRQTSCNRIFKKKSIAWSMECCNHNRRD